MVPWYCVAQVSWPPGDSRKTPDRLHVPRLLDVLVSGFPVLSAGGGTMVLRYYGTVSPRRRGPQGVPGKHLISACAQAVGCPIFPGLRPPLWVVVLRFYGSMVLWYYGTMVLRRPSVVAPQGIPGKRLISACAQAAGCPIFPDLWSSLRIVKPWCPRTCKKISLLLR